MQKSDIFPSSAESTTTESMSSSVTSEDADFDEIWELYEMMNFKAEEEKILQCIYIPLSVRKAYVNKKSLIFHQILIQFVETASEFNICLQIAARVIQECSTTLTNARLKHFANSVANFVSRYVMCTRFFNYINNSTLDKKNGRINNNVLTHENSNLLILMCFDFTKEYCSTLNEYFTESLKNASHKLDFEYLSKINDESSCDLAQMKIQKERNATEAHSFNSPESSNSFVITETTAPEIIKAITQLANETAKSSIVRDTLEDTPPKILSSSNEMATDLEIKPNNDDHCRPNHTPSDDINSFQISEVSLNDQPDSHFDDDDEPNDKTHSIEKTLTTTISPSLLPELPYHETDSPNNNTIHKLIDAIDNLSIYDKTSPTTITQKKQLPLLGGDITKFPSASNDLNGIANRLSNENHTYESDSSDEDLDEQEVMPSAFTKKIYG